MNKKSFFRIVMMTSILSVIVISCAKDDTNEIIPLDRDKFIGTWHVSSHGSNSGDLTWDLIIEPATLFGAEQIIMKNFDQTGVDSTVYADVSGSNLTIPGTHVGAVMVEGTGSLSGGTLSLNYISVDSDTDFVTATAIK